MKGQSYISIRMMTAWCVNNDVWGRKHRKQTSELKGTAAAKLAKTFEWKASEFPPQRKDEKKTLHISFHLLRGNEKQRSAPSGGRLRWWAEFPHPQLLNTDLVSPASVWERKKKKRNGRRSPYAEIYIFICDSWGGGLFGKAPFWSDVGRRRRRRRRREKIST